jgi:dimethylhistidine N-methyltransferase
MKPSASSAALVHLGADSAGFLPQVLTGLSKSPRTLPCKFFYDEHGSELFRRICDLPEYYITRAELQILRLQGREIAATLGPHIELIGLGTGAGTKTRILLAELTAPVVYIPIDISGEQLQKSTLRFRTDFPGLTIRPISADYLEPFELPLPRPPSARSVIYFPGSTIGNFEPAAARDFLARLADMVRPDGGLLIGVDLQKDPAVIERAYNDKAGVTAQFNLNLLARANRDLAADFALEHWRHQAIYNQTQGRIEMYLVSATKQAVHIGDRRFDFAKDEKILTEYSYKHTAEGFSLLASKAGFAFQRLWTDTADLFGLFYFTVMG